MRVLGRSLWRLVRLALIMGVGVATLVVSVVALRPSAHDLTRSVSSTDAEVDLPPLGGSSVMYDRFGNPLQSFEAEKRDVVTLRQVSPTVIESVLAVEDSGFYRHGPVDARSILRAARTNVDAGGAQQGGSTITQQVIKQSVTGSQRTLHRKINEAKLATQLEKQMTKDEILQRYLNIIYLGNNSYGVQAAAQTYWGVNARQLDWAQAALLAALIRDPNGYDPIRHPAAARQQRSLALRRLVSTGRLSQADADLAQTEPLPTKLVSAGSSLPDQYFVQEVEDRLLNKDGSYNGTAEGTALGKTYKERYNAFFRGGLRIYTTYDPASEAKAVDARQASNIPGGMRPNGTFWLPDYVDPKTGQSTPSNGTMAIVSVEPGTGAVRTLLGGPGLDVSRVDIATSKVGQTPGSSFKTFVLAAAMDLGYVPDDMIDGNSPCSFRPDDPRYVDPAQPWPGDHGGANIHNYGGEGGSVNTLTSQTLVSSNCAFALLGQVVGLRNVDNMARAMGLTNCVSQEPAEWLATDTCLSGWRPLQAFGETITVTPLDMADAYATLANDGVHNASYFVDRIDDASGHVVWAHRAKPTRAMSPQTARLVTQILQANVEGGTGTAAQLYSGQPAAGKTGTTDSAKNIWFVGYTPQLATAVWIGSLGNQVPIAGGGATGGVYAAYSWGVYMASLLDGTPIVPFPAAAPTRLGTILNLGPNDGSPPDFSAAEKVKLSQHPVCGAGASGPGVDPGTAVAPIDGSACGGGDQQNGTDNPDSTGGATGAQPPTSSAPPVTSYPPQ